MGRESLTQKAPKPESQPLAGIVDSSRVCGNCVFGFCLYRDRLGVALLPFICGCHRDLDLGKSMVPCAVSRIAACFRKNANPIIGIDVWFMIMNVSPNV